MCLTVQILGACGHVEDKRVLPCDVLAMSHGQRCRETEVAFEWMNEDCWECEGRAKRPMDYLIRKATDLRNLK